MRVLVATDVIGSLSSAEAGAALAVGWSGEDVQVLPIGESGAGFVAAYADRLGVATRLDTVETHLVESARHEDLALLGLAAGERTADPLTASSYALGAAIRTALEAGDVRRIVVDLGGPPGHDAGAGLLAALGATADRPLDRGPIALTGIGRIELDDLHERLAGIELVGVVPGSTRAARLLGLRGISSLRGRAEDWDTADMLAADTALDAYARLVGPERRAEAGAGACGGLGFALLALGGVLTTGPGLAFDEAAGPPWDLVVTGSSLFDFATRGGGVVAAVAEHAAAALSPCVVVAGEVLIGAREMRTMGIEAAYAVHESRLDRPAGMVHVGELTRVAERVARSWRW